VVYPGSMGSAGRMRLSRCFVLEFPIAEVAFATENTLQSKRGGVGGTRGGYAGGGRYGGGW
jgi:hypothetical protein